MSELISNGKRVVTFREHELSSGKTILVAVAPVNGDRIAILVPDPDCKIKPKAGARILVTTGRRAHSPVWVDGVVYPTFKAILLEERAVA